jgi:hypothetical protein
MKRHLITSDDPLKPGGTLVALCGAEIANAHFPFFWEDELQPNCVEFLFSMRVCRQCASHPFDKRYLYGLVNGESVKQEQVA